LKIIAIRRTQKEIDSRATRKKKADLEAVLKIWPRASRGKVYYFGLFRTQGT